MITIHERHRRTDRRTDGRHAISIPRYAHSASRGKNLKTFSEKNVGFPALSSAEIFRFVKFAKHLNEKRLSVV